MATKKSANEILNRYLQCMGPELGEVFHALSDDVVWMHMKWKQYLRLYAQSPERIDLLNEVAGHFFSVIRATLVEDVILGLARLTDSIDFPGKQRKQHLTLKMLANLIPEPTFAAELTGLVDAACTACESPRLLRHGIYAHRDLALALLKSSTPLPKINNANIEAALNAIRAVLNRLEEHYCRSETVYQDSLVTGDADSLVFFLQKGLEAEEQRRERHLKGKPLPEDLEPDSEI